ncbi:MAG: 6-bladed beta-propeller [Gemmatimonadota bacterium]
MKTRRLFLTLSLLVAGLPGAAFAQRPAQEELVWPLPPEPPKIRYVGQLQSEADIGKTVGFFTKLKNMLAGTQSSVLGLQRPFDVYVDGGTRFFVADGARGKGVLFNADTRSAKIIGEGGLGNLRKPMGLGGDRQGRVYVADASGARVVAFDRDGAYVGAYGGESMLLNPVDVAVDPDRGRLYVVDSYLHQVVAFSIETGDVLFRIGKDEDDLAAKRTYLRGRWRGGVPLAGGHERGEVEDTTHAGTEPSDLVLNRGSGPGEFRYPGYAAVAPDGTLYVTDQLNFRVQAFTPEGEFIRQIGRIGRTPGSFSRPKGVAVDTEGHIYVADALFNNIQIFNAEGQLLLVFGNVGTGEGELYMPLGVQIDERDRIYVADRYNNRIQVYQFLGAEDSATDAAPASSADTAGVRGPAGSGS